MVFSLLVAGGVVVLTVALIDPAELPVALWGLAAVPLAFLGVVAFTFTRAFKRPGKHRDWDRLDYGVHEDLLRLRVRSLEPLRPRSGPPKPPLVCRIVAPGGSVWISYAQDRTRAPCRHAGWRRGARR
jgi:hypothetical protein